MQLAPALLTLLLLAPAPLATSHEACAPVDATTVSCRWTHEATSGLTGPPTWEFPVFERTTLASFVVTLTQRPDTGWLLEVERLVDGEWEEVSAWQHAPSRTPATRTVNASTHVLVGGETYRVRFSPGWTEAPTSPPLSQVGFGAGTYEIAYVGRAVAEGTLPVRPAATAADPQLLDDPSEVAEPAWDIRAAWWDDARLEDGLFDVHLRVGDLNEIPASAFRAPGSPGETGQVYELSWKAAWKVGGESYYVEWVTPREMQDGQRVFTCELRTEREQEADEVILAHPLCEVDLATSTLHAIVPEAAIGSPPVGEPFTDLAARTRARYTPGATDVLDEQGQPRYLFALGGPAVWSALNPRLDPTPTAWYVDPLAPENIADTVQLGGALVAVVTFFVGLLLVVRRRKDTARLLARVDEIEEGGVDSADVLLRLGKLEQEFNALFRRHKISDAQYQVLSQRIAGVATRFALRRSLGLDDGVPGEAGPARRVPIVEKRDPKIRP